MGLREVVAHLVAHPDLSNRGTAKALGVGRRRVDRARILMRDTGPGLLHLLAEAQWASPGFAPKGRLLKVHPDWAEVERRHREERLSVGTLWRGYTRQWGRKALAPAQFTALLRRYRTAHLAQLHYAFGERPTAAGRNADRLLAARRPGAGATGLPPTLPDLAPRRGPWGTESVRLH